MTELSCNSWKEGLSHNGLYYSGIIDATKLNEVLEMHKRDTVSTFGTRSSRRVLKPRTNNDESHHDECSVSVMDTNKLATDVNTVG